MQRATWHLQRHIRAIQSATWPCHRALANARPCDKIVAPCFAVADVIAASTDAPAVPACWYHQEPRVRAAGPPAACLCCDAPLPAPPDAVVDFDCALAVAPGSVLLRCSHEPASDATPVAASDASSAGGFRVYSVTVSRREFVAARVDSRPSCIAASTAAATALSAALRSAACSPGCACTQRRLARLAAVCRSDHHSTGGEPSCFRAKASHKNGCARGQA